MRRFLLALLTLYPVATTLAAAAPPAQYGWEEEEEEFAWVDTRGFGFVPVEDAEVIEEGNGQVYLVTVLPPGTASTDPPIKLVAIPGSTMQAPDLLQALLADTQANLPEGLQLLAEPESLTRKVGGAETTGWAFTAEHDTGRRRYEIFAWLDGGAPRGFVGWHRIGEGGSHEFEDAVATVRNSVIAYTLEADTTRLVDFGSFSMQVPLVAAFDSRKAADGALHATLRFPGVELTLLTSGKEESNAYGVLKDWFAQRRIQLPLEAARIEASLSPMVPTALALDGWLLPGQRGLLTLPDGNEGYIHDFGLVCADRVLTLTWNTHVQQAAQAQAQVRKLLDQLFYPDDPKAMLKTKEGRSRHLADGVTFTLPGGMQVAAHAIGSASWELRTGTEEAAGPRFAVEVVEGPVATVSLTSQASILAEAFRKDEAVEPLLLFGETTTAEAKLLGAQRTGYHGTLTIDGSPHTARFFAAPLPTANEQETPRTLVVGTVFPPGDQDAILLLERLMDAVQVVGERPVEVEGKTWVFRATADHDLSHYSFAESDGLEIHGPSGTHLEAYATTSLRKGDRDLPALEKAIKTREEVADLLLRAEAGNHAHGRHAPRKQEKSRGFTTLGAADAFAVAYSTWLEATDTASLGDRIFERDRAIYTFHTRRTDAHLKTVVPSGDPQATSAMEDILGRLEIEQPLPHPPRVLVSAGRRILIPQDLPVTTSFLGSNSTLTIEPPDKAWSALLFGGFMVPNMPPEAFLEAMFEQSATMLGEEIVRGYADPNADIETVLTEATHHLVHEQEMNGLTITSVDGTPDLKLLLAMAADGDWFRQGTIVGKVDVVDGLADRIAPIFQSAETVPTLLHLGSATRSLELPVEDWYLRTPIQDPGGWILQPRSGGGQNRLLLTADAFQLDGVDGTAPHPALTDLVAQASSAEGAPVLEPRMIQLGATLLNLQAPPEAELQVDGYQAVLQVPGGARLSLTLLGPDAHARAIAFSKAAQRANDAYEVSELQVHAVWRMLAGTPSEGLRLLVERGFVKLVREVHAVETEGFSLLVETEHHADTPSAGRQVQAMLDSLRL